MLHLKMCYFICNTTNIDIDNLFLLGQDDEKKGLLGSEMYHKFRFFLYQFELEKLTNYLINKYNFLQLQVSNLTITILPNADICIRDRYGFLIEHIMSKVEEDINKESQIVIKNKFAINKYQLILLWLNYLINNTKQFPLFFSFWTAEINMDTKKTSFFIYNPNNLDNRSEQIIDITNPNILSLEMYCQALNVELEQIEDIFKKNDNLFIDKNQVFNEWQLSSDLITQIYQSYLYSITPNDLVLQFRVMVNFFITGFFWDISKLPINQRHKLNYGNYILNVDTKPRFKISIFLTVLELLFIKLIDLIHKQIDLIQCTHLSSEDWGKLKQYLYIMFDNLIIEILGLFLKNFLLFDNKFDINSKKILIEHNFETINNITNVENKSLQEFFDKLGVQDISILNSKHSVIESALYNLYYKCVLNPNYKPFPVLILYFDSNKIQFSSPNDIKSIQIDNKFFKRFILFNYFELLANDPMYKTAQTLNQHIINKDTLQVIEKTYHNLLNNNPKKKQKITIIDVHSFYYKYFLERYRIYLNPHDNNISKVESKRRIFHYNTQLNLYIWSLDLLENNYIDQMSYLPILFSLINQYLDQIDTQNKQLIINTYFDILLAQMKKIK